MKLLEGRTLTPDEEKFIKAYRAADPNFKEAAKWILYTFPKRKVKHEEIVYTENGIINFSKTRKERNNDY